MVLRVLMLMSILCGVSVATAADDALYQTRCAACHQSSGEGSVALKVPNISGLSESYLLRQLYNFQSGVRGDQAKDAAGQMMRAALTGLAKEELDALAGYVATLADVSLFTERQATGFRGRGLYSVCSSCHGAQGEGNVALGAPRLNQQYRWYLTAQLKNYQLGLRGTKGEDEYGRKMRAMAESVHEDDMELLVRHISGLGLQP